jgi:hypothetical protein
LPDLTDNLYDNVGSSVPITARSVFNKMLLFAPVSFKDFSISGYAKRYLTAPTNFLSAVAVLVDRDKYKEYNYD